MRHSNGLGAVILSLEQFSATVVTKAGSFRRPGGNMINRFAAFADAAAAYRLTIFSIGKS